MACWTRRRGSKLVTVYYYDTIAKKNVQVPRAECRHLDDLDDDRITEWVRDWENAHGVAVHRVQRYQLRQGDDLSSCWAAFTKEYQLMRGVKDVTMRDTHDAWAVYILPYFIGIHGLKNVRKWRHQIADFPVYLLSQETRRGTLDISSVKKILWLLNNFGRWLAKKEKISQPWILDIPSANYVKETPLKVRVDPEAALQTARALLAKSPLAALGVLCGYFGGLSPSEFTGLHHKDFLTGNKNASQCETYTGFKRYDMGSKLIISVERAKIASEEEEVKNQYRREYVCIWDMTAAQLIVDILKTLPAGPIWSWTRGHYDKVYTRDVRPLLNVTPHDLRRSSCLWLLRTKNIDIMLAKSHFRHSLVSTTILYARSPGDKERDEADRDLDDIA
ncbi:MAG: hypothetical protein NTZ90_10815 [Proteobacteria bacterium]|nr:hypothetical protein [Pseudomonadota bacterium]